jgi:hypothetical protein
MASWSHDVRPMALVDWGLHHNEIGTNAVIPEDEGVRPEIRPSCILATGTEVGEE